MKFSEKNEIMQALAMLTHIGITMSICMIGCFLFGRFLDDKLGTGPWLLIVFGLLGVASAFYSLYKIAMSIGNK